MDIEAGRNGSFPRLPSRTARVTGVRGRLTTGNALLVSAFFVCFVMLYQSTGQFQLTLTRAPPSRPTETVVVYVYSNTDPEYEGNLVYFLEKGVAANDGCDYIIVIQEGNGVEETHGLPETPPNVRFVRHANECYDWGTLGWALETGIFNPAKYKYLILLNSSVRGPFLPPYWPPHLHWTDGLTSRINDEVKMVGSTISCEGSWKGGVLTGEKRQNPHVQSYVVAMDQTALRLVQDDPTVLRCYQEYHDAVWYGEMGSSAAILRAGYNIDALMLRYQGVDWRQTENWGCNAALNPYAEHMYDGIDLSPFEIMFVKLKEFLLEANWTTATQGKKYSQWSIDKGDIRANEYTTKKEHLRLIKILGMRHRGPACFDFEMYRKRNPDLPKWGNNDLWEHFVKHGQHEGRVFRFRCPPAVDGDGAQVQGAAAGAAAGGGGGPQAEAVLTGAAASAVEAAAAAVTEPRDAEGGKTEQQQQPAMTVQSSSVGTAVAAEAEGGDISVGPRTAKAAAAAAKQAWPEQPRRQQQEQVQQQQQLSQQDQQQEQDQPSQQTAGKELEGAEPQLSSAVDQLSLAGSQGEEQPVDPAGTKNAK